MKALNIRHADQNDARVLADLSARTFKNAYADQLAGDALDSFVTETFSPGRIVEEIRDPACTFLLAFAGDELIGYAMLRDRQPPPGVPAGRSVELARIYLEEKAIGQGYGAALMQASVEKAVERGCKSIWLGVWEKNGRAIRFYEKWGFSQVGADAFAFGDEIQTDLVMARIIEGQFN